MNNKHEGDYRGFIQHSRSYYANVVPLFDDCRDEIMFGYYSTGGGTSGEMAIRWYDVGPRLEAYNDSWSALNNMQDVISLMGEFNDYNPSTEEFCELLKSCGFIDMTKTKSPYEQ